MRPWASCWISPFPARFGITTPPFCNPAGCVLCARLSRRYSGAPCSSSRSADRSNPAAKARCWSLRRMSYRRSVAAMSRRILATARKCSALECSGICRLLALLKRLWKSCRSIGCGKIMSMRRTIGTASLILYATRGIPRPTPQQLHRSTAGASIGSRPSRSSRALRRRSIVADRASRPASPTLALTQPGDMPLYLLLPLPRGRCPRSRDKKSCRGKAHQARDATGGEGKYPSRQLGWTADRIQRNTERQRADETPADADRGIERHYRSLSCRITTVRSSRSEVGKIALNDEPGSQRQRCHLDDRENGYKPKEPQSSVPIQKKCGVMAQIPVRPAAPPANGAPQAIGAFSSCRRKPPADGSDRATTTATAGISS
jgi:hypothetical protein